VCLCICVRNATRKEQGVRKGEKGETFLLLPTCWLHNMSYYGKVYVHQRTNGLAESFPWIVRSHVTLYCTECTCTLTDGNTTLRPTKVHSLHLLLPTCWLINISYYGKVYVHQRTNWSSRVLLLDCEVTCCSQLY